MKRFLVTAALSASMLSAQSAGVRLWWGSVVTLAAASSFDGYTSVQPGLRETNPLLSSSGRFGAKAEAFKAGSFAGAIVPQYFMVRKHPKRAKVYMLVNFGLSGFFIWAGRHNLSEAQR